MDAGGAPGVQGQLHGVAFTSTSVASLGGAAGLDIDVLVNYWGEGVGGKLTRFIFQMAAFSVGNLSFCRLEANFSRCEVPSLLPLPLLLLPLFHEVISR